MSNIKHAIKKALQAYAPQALFAVQAYRARRMFKDTFEKRQVAMAKAIYGTGPAIVLSGPFKGMKYLSEIVWGPIESKWLGIYEKELHDVVALANERAYETIIDVGAAEGYYGVGLARLHPSVPVFAYDIDPWARAQQGRLAKLNNVTNLSIGGMCTTSELASHIGKRTLLVCDIEGYEYTLLDPTVSPGLLRCDIIVELHKGATATMSIDEGAQELTRRFGATHDCVVIPALPRTLEDWDPSLAPNLAPSEAMICLDEKRDPLAKWMWISLKAH